MDFLFIALGLGFFAASWWFVRVCASLQPGEEDEEMSALYILGLAVTLLLTVYLFAALLKPEKF